MRNQPSSAISQTITPDSAVETSTIIHSSSMSKSIGEDEEILLQGTFSSSAGSSSPTRVLANETAIPSVSISSISSPSPSLTPSETGGSEIGVSTVTKASEGFGNSGGSSIIPLISVTSDSATSSSLSAFATQSGSAATSGTEAEDRKTSDLVSESAPTPSQSSIPNEGEGQHGANQTLSESSGSASSTPSQTQSEATQNLQPSTTSSTETQDHNPSESVSGSTPTPRQSPGQNEGEGQRRVSESLSGSSIPSQTQTEASQTLQPFETGKATITTFQSVEPEASQSQSGSQTSETAEQPSESDSAQTVKTPSPSGENTAKTTSEVAPFVISSHLPAGPSITSAPSNEFLLSETAAATSKSNILSPEPDKITTTTSATGSSDEGTARTSGIITNLPVIPLPTGSVSNPFTSDDGKSATKSSSDLSASETLKTTEPSKSVIPNPDVPDKTSVAISASITPAFLEKTESVVSSKITSEGSNSLASILAGASVSISGSIPKETEPALPSKTESAGLVPVASISGAASTSISVGIPAKTIPVELSSSAKKPESPAANPSNTGVSLPVDSSASTISSLQAIPSKPTESPSPGSEPVVPSQSEPIATPPPNSEPSLQSQSETSLPNSDSSRTAPIDDKSSKPILPLPTESPNNSIPPVIPNPESASVSVNVASSTAVSSNEPIQTLTASRSIDQNTVTPVVPVVPASLGGISAPIQTPAASPSNDNPTVTPTVPASNAESAAPVQVSTEPIASTGGKPAIIIAPTSSAPAEFPASSGFVAPVVVSPSIGSIQTPGPSPSNDQNTLTPPVVPISNAESSSPIPASTEPPASNGGKPAIVVSPTLSATPVSPASSGGVPPVVLSPSIGSIQTPAATPSHGKNTATAPVVPVSNAESATPTPVSTEPLASTGGKPEIVISPTLSATSESPASTGGVPPIVVLPSSSAKATEPSHANVPAPESSAGSSTPIIFGPSGTLAITAKPTVSPVSSEGGTLIASSVPSLSLKSNTAEGTQPTNSAYDASGLLKASPPSGTGTPPTETPNTTNAPTAGPTPVVSSGEAGPSQAVSRSNVPSAASQGPSDTLGIVSSQPGASQTGDTGATQPGPTLSASSPTQTGGSPGSSAPSPASAQGTTATASGPEETKPLALSLTPAPVVPATETSSAPGTIYQKPISTDTATAQSVPSSIVVASTASGTTASGANSPTGIPSDVPHIIAPPEGVPQAPPNTTLIQIGFLYGLNYKFVLENPKSQQQIFKFLPMGISYGLDIPRENVTMQTLRAYDTTKDLGYITTFALSWIPSDQVDLLSLKLKTPSDRIYNNSDTSVHRIMSLINPAMPILSDNKNINGDPASPSGSSASASASVASQQGVPIGPGVNNSAPIQPHSVGIAAGVVCGAAAYGAAMFFVARRYRKRKQSHRRSPSMFSSPVMTGSPHDFIGGANTALMSGGRGDADRSISPPNGYHHGRDSRGSGRSGSTGRQQISAPVMAENSLGWN